MNGVSLLPREMTRPSGTHSRGFKFQLFLIITKTKRAINKPGAGKKFNILNIWDREIRF